MENKVLIIIEIEGYLCSEGENYKTSNHFGISSRISIWNYNQSKHSLEYRIYHTGQRKENQQTENDNNFFLFLGSFSFWFKKHDYTRIIITNQLFKLAKKNSKKFLWLEFVWINSLNNNNNNKDFFRNWKLSIWTTTTTTTIIIIMGEIIFLLFMSDQGNDHDHVCYTRVERVGKKPNFYR